MKRNNFERFYSNINMADVINSKNQEDSLCRKSFTNKNYVTKNFLGRPDLQVELY